MLLSEITAECTSRKNDAYKIPVGILLIMWKLPAASTYPSVACTFDKNNFFSLKTKGKVFLCTGKVSEVHFIVTLLP